MRIADLLTEIDDPEVNYPNYVVYWQIWELMVREVDQYISPSLMMEFVKSLSGQKS